MIWFQPRYTRLGSEIPEHIYVRWEYLFLIIGIVENEKKKRNLGFLWPQQFGSDLKAAL